MLLFCDSIFYSILHSSATAWKPNGDLNNFSIGLGLTGLGITNKVDYSKYIGTTNTNQNE